MEFIVEYFGLHGYKENERARVENCSGFLSFEKLLKGRKHYLWNAVYVFSSTQVCYKCLARSHKRCMNWMPNDT